MRFVAFVVGLLTAAGAAQASECTGRADVIGTSRTIAVDPGDHLRVGTMQYRETLPLADKEVVLTFDDGPLPPYSRTILDTLNMHCVKATYFMVGRMARAYPEIVRAIARAGHTIGTHSQNHPMSFDALSAERMAREIDGGVSSVAAALGDAGQVAPFFRVPGLRRGTRVETALAQRGLEVWSADFPADDWRHISADEIVKRAMDRLASKGRGILLLHDIQPATALALPTLLQRLHDEGYKIVHVVPASSEQPATATIPEQWVLHRPPVRQAGSRARTLPLQPTAPIRWLPENAGITGVAAFGPALPLLPARVSAPPWKTLAKVALRRPSARPAAKQPTVAEPEAGLLIFLGSLVPRGSIH